jgi:hypothetical protein
MLAILFTGFQDFEFIKPTMRDAKFEIAQKYKATNPVSPDTKSKRTENKGIMSQTMRTLYFR